MITIVKGDLLTQDVDAIVNAANGHLRHGGGVARLIDIAAQNLNHGGQADSAAQWRKENRAAPLVPTGGAHVTSAGCLPFRGVIHAVGPVWGGGQYHERELLVLAHHNALTQAEARGWSVAFPALSCGIFGYPVELAATVAISAAKNAAVDVTFALFEDAHFSAYAEAVINSPAAYTILANLRDFC